MIKRWYFHSFLKLAIGDTFEFKGHRQFSKSSEQENLREVQLTKITDNTRSNKFSFHANFVLLLCILDTGVKTPRKTYIWMLSLSFSILCVGQHAHIRKLFILLSNLTIRKSLYSIGTSTNYLACATRIHGYVLRCLAQPQAMIS